MVWYRDIYGLISGYLWFDDIRIIRVWYQDIYGLISGYLWFGIRIFMVWCYQDIYGLISGYLWFDIRIFLVWYQGIYVLMISGYIWFDIRIFMVWWYQDIYGLISGYLWFDIEGSSQFRFHFQFADFISSENRKLHKWVNVRQTYKSHIGNRVLVYNSSKFKKYILFYRNH